ncbi:MAG TPA: hypothetical protein VGZ02_16330 [Candidatus Baltobacteraceae bacterium]|jgi:hypothetical protein|nr:hypothetical protein [Candidatus Baltobacteraceae bacterium]
MVQIIFDMLGDAWQRIANSFFMLEPVLRGAFIAFVVIAIGIGILDRAKLLGFLSGVPIVLRRSAAWAGVAAAVAAAVMLLHLVQIATDQRFGAMENAQTTSGADTDATSMLQPAPSAYYLTQKTYRRILTLPPELLTRITTEGVDVLAPYLTDPSMDSVTRLSDTFRRSGKRIVFQRDATLAVQQPIKLDASTIDEDLAFTDPAFGGRRSFFNSKFNATYVFHNPTSGRAHVRFSFPLPSGSGTLSNARFVVNGTAMDVSDLTNGFVWEGDLPQNAAATVQVSYANQGARGWSYGLSMRREPIAKLDLTVHSNRTPKYARYSVFPTSASRAFGGSSTTMWHLENVVTAQNIGLVFSQLDVRETLARMLSFAPLALVLAGMFVAVTAWRRHRAITPLQATIATAGFTLGLALAGIFTWYVPLILAVCAGCGVALLLAVRALGREFALPAALATALMLAFLCVTNTSLLLVATCTAALWFLVPMPGLHGLFWSRA